MITDSREVKNNRRDFISNDLWCLKEANLTALQMLKEMSEKNWNGAKKAAKTIEDFLGELLKEIRGPHNHSHPPDWGIGFHLINEFRKNLKRLHFNLMVHEYKGAYEIGLKVNKLLESAIGQAESKLTEDR